MKTQHTSKRWWIVLALVSFSLVLIALVGQSVTARPVSHDLQPPFRFVEQALPAQPEAQTLPPGSSVIVTETFGASFAPVIGWTDSTPQWRLIINPGDTAGYYWDKVGAASPITFTNSAWNAARRFTATQVLTPGLSPYPAGQDTWLVYGPINLSKFSYAQLNFGYYLDSQAGDSLLWGYSFDGQTFYGNTQSGPLGEWITDTFTFHSNPAYQSVYVAFAFNSQSSGGLGAFIRNVELTAEPMRFSYLPALFMDYAEPTLTPTPTPTPVPSLYGYTFDQDNADLTKWGGAYYHTGTTKYGQCIPGECAMHYTTAHGNPANSLRLYTNGLYSFIASSPNDITPDNYDLYVDISPWVIYPRDAGCVLYGCPSNDLGDWYGIIFNASSGTFGANPSQFAYNGVYYRVYFYNIDATKPIAIQLDRCDGGATSADNSCHKLGSSSLPSNFIGNASGFDTVHIQRLASGAIQVWLNGNLLITANDATYTGSAYGKYGTFIFSWDNNATQNPPAGYEMQVDFDNILVYQR